VYDRAVLIAQALGEYGALAALVEAFQHAYVQVEYALGQWGTRGVIALAAVALLWRIIGRFK